MASDHLKREIDDAMKELRQGPWGIGHLYQAKLLQAVNVEVIDLDGGYHSRTFGRDGASRRFLTNR